MALSKHTLGLIAKQHSVQLTKTILRFAHVLNKPEIQQALQQVLERDLQQAVDMGYRSGRENAGPIAVTDLSCVLVGDEDIKQLKKSKNTMN